MEDIRLVVSDMDGTLLNERSELSGYSFHVLERICQKGIRFVPVSGRGTATLLPKIRNLPFIDYFVSANGAVICDARDSSVIICHQLSKEEAFMIYEMALEKHVKATFIIDGFYFDENGLSQRSLMQMSYADEHYKDVLQMIENKGIEAAILDERFAVHKVTLSFDDMDLRRKFRSKLEADGRLHVSNALTTNLEISSASGSKGNALISLSKLYQIPLKNVLALGDATNDISMFREAGLSVAMINSIEETKKYADLISEEDNAHDGAAKMIEKLCL